EPIRVGLLIDSLTAPAWVYTMVEHILAGTYARIVVVVRNDAPSGARTLGNWNTILARGYLKLDKRIFGRRSDAFVPRSIEKLLEGVPVIGVLPQRSTFSDRIRQEDLDKIRGQKPDVLIRLGFKILRGEILTVARHGIWSFHHGDNALNRGGPPGL